jgi:ribosomal protein S18 acetylase RimI-like enzyme
MSSGEDGAVERSSRDASHYEVTTDSARLDISAIHAFLSQSYWAKRIPLETLRRAIQHSVCVGAMKDGQQVGFARVVTDHATFAYLADVYVLEAHRENGVARAMLNALFALPELQGLRRLLLITRDAHGLYEKFGFTTLAQPARFMERHNPNAY